MLSEHPEVLRDRREVKIVINSSFLVKMNIGAASSKESSTNWNEGFASPCCNSPALISSPDVFYKQYSV